MKRPRHARRVALRTRRLSGFGGLLGEDLVHVARRLRAAGLAYDACGNPRHRLIVRHRGKHHRARSDARAIAYLDVAEDLRPRSDEHAVPDLGVAVAGLLACAAERHTLQD